MNIDPGSLLLGMGIGFVVTLVICVIIGGFLARNTTHRK